MGTLNRSISLLFTRRFVSCLKSNVTVTQQSRLIMTTAAAAEKALENMKSNPYFDKYYKKMAVLQQTSPEEFLAKLEEAKKTEKPLPTPKEHDCSTTASSKSKKDVNPAFMQYKPRSLADVMKIELLENKSTEEIQKIWHEYYKLKDGLAAAIPADVYSKIMETSQKFPIFLLPLPRSNGYEFIVCQFGGHDIHFTSLINYQTHKENAPECLTLHHYSELMDTKNIVLMRGEFDINALDAKEAQCLANQIQLYYGQPNEKRLKLLERFTYTPGDFKHMDLVAELECLSL